MRVSSIITNNKKCGANYVHYLLASEVEMWDVISLRGREHKLYDMSIYSLISSRFNLLFRSGLIVEELSELLESTDVILGDGLAAYFYMKKLSFKYPEKKFYALVHNDYTIDNRTNWNMIPNRIFNYIYDYILKDLSIITTSHSAHKALKSRQLSVSSINNGVLNPITSNIKGDESKVNFWFIGRLVKVKQVDLLIKAFSVLPKNCTLNIVGDGDQKEYLLKLCENLNVNYHYWGQKDKPFFNVCKGDVFILPSLVEGRSIALMEAMLAGCCCIVSNIDSNKEFIKYGAITFDVLSQTDLSSKLLDVSKLSLNERLSITDMSKADLDFSVHSMVSKYLELFNE
ncbi:hypothetical protein BCT90_22160 [Vibrio lentus]|uniref:glycosyltransferase family 4 protein n=1 Tax=Vibrio lentus TaxID=136468 RepID=UPI000C864622|nr:glycosyltransferase family 4 protein [Vibrio lentus]PMK98506.1 hypothetical protein BCT90_22160 [Vibrio lentus]